MIELQLLLRGDRSTAARLREMLEREGFEIEGFVASRPGEASSDPGVDEADSEENGELSRQIEELEFALRELRNLDVAKSQFLANVSHELRTPLTAIVTYGEVLRDGLLGKLSERQREAIQSIISSSRQLLSMIEQILIYARTNARAIELEPSPFGIVNVVDAVHDMSASLIRKKRLRFVAEIDSDLPEAHGDRDKILHVLTNLVGNAIEFTPTGGQIRIQACRDSRDPRWLRVVVEDSGIGIDPEHHDMIFHEFAQVDSSRARQHHGTGLGLAIARNFILLHGGEIGVDSVLGQGSRFYFTLPSVEAAETLGAA